MHFFLLTDWYGTVSRAIRLGLSYTLRKESKLFLAFNQLKALSFKPADRAFNRPNDILTLSACNRMNVCYFKKNGLL